MIDENIACFKEMSEYKKHHKLNIKVKRMEFEQWRGHRRNQQSTDRHFFFSDLKDFLNYRSPKTKRFSLHMIFWIIKVRIAPFRFYLI